MRALQSVTRLPLALLASGFSLAIGSPVAMAGTLAEAVAGGKAGIELRYRFDQVQDDAVAKDANASTLKTRLNYTTGSWQEMTGFVEMDNVSRVGDDRYNDNRNGKAAFAMVPDPDGTDLNQAWLRFGGIEKTTITAGRQRIAFDNHRVIGSSPGRQNEQTYDGVTVEYKGIDKLVASFAYVTRVNTVSGPEPARTAFQPPAERDTEMPLLNVKYTFSDAFALAGYHYAMDFDKSAALSNATTGLRAAGQIPVAGEMKLDYVAELARQTDHANQPASYDAGYWHGDLKLTAGRFSAGIGHETLEADGGMRFITPLATLKFHGLAEKFWQTPAGGIEDTWLSLGANVADWRLMLKYHQLQPEAAGRDYGDEVDFTAFRALGRNYQVLFVHTVFMVDGPAYTNAAFPGMTFDDTQKTYLALMAKF